jgi:hypothetical protein
MLRLIKCPDPKRDPIEPVEDEDERLPEPEPDEDDDGGPLEAA